MRDLHNGVASGARYLAPFARITQVGRAAALQSVQARFAPHQEVGAVARPHVRSLDGPGGRGEVHPVFGEQLDFTPVAEMET